MRLQKIYISNVFNGLVIISLVSVGLLIGCHADEYTDPGATQVTVTGTVIDAETELPIAGASVRSDNNAVTVLTNDKGLFLLENVGVNKIGEVIITFFKEGYLGNQKVFVVEHGKTYSAKLRMQPYGNLRLVGEQLGDQVIIAKTEIDVTIEIPGDTGDASNPKAIFFIPKDSLSKGPDPDNNPLTYTVRATVLDPSDSKQRGIFPGFFLTAPNDFFRPDALLESAVFVNVMISDNNDTQVTSLLKPATYYLRLPSIFQEPADKQNTYGEGDSIEWWSFRNTRGHWGQELSTAIVTKQIADFPGISKWYVKVDASQLTWFSAGPQIKDLSCLGVNVVNQNGEPVSGAIVNARGVSYLGNSLPVLTNSNGFAQLLVKPSDPNQSSIDPETVTVQVTYGAYESQYIVNDSKEGIPTNNQIFTSIIANSFIIKNGVEYGDCKILQNPLVVDLSRTVYGVLRYQGSLNIVPNYPVYTDIGVSVKSDENGNYTMSVPVTSVTYYVFASVDDTASPIFDVSPMYEANLTVQTPIINSLTRVPSGTVVEVTEVKLKVSAKDLEDPSLPLTYTWTSKDGNGVDAGTFTDATLAEVVWTAPLFSITDVANITVVVDNGQGGNIEQTLIVKLVAATAQ